MLPALASAALQVGGNLLSTGLSNMSANNATKKAYKYNMWMWNAQNEYNLPINQMKRLREADLNPNLVYGHGTSTLASTPSSVGAPSRYPYQLDVLENIKTYKNIEQMDAMTQNIKAQKLTYTAQALSALAKSFSDWKDWETYDKTGAHPGRSVPQQAVNFIMNGIRDLARPAMNWVGDRITDFNYPYGAKGARKNPLLIR